MKHSIRVRVTIVYMLSIIFILLGTLAMNSWGLERFYLDTTVRQISSAYERINTIVMQAHENDEEILSEIDRYVEGTATHQLADIISEYSDKYNTTIVVADSNTSTSLFSSERNGVDLWQRMQTILFSDTDQSGEDVVKKTTNYQIFTRHSSQGTISSVDMFGYCDDNYTMIIMTMPMADIRANVDVANKFAMYVVVIAALASLIIIYFLTRQVTLPIQQLADISKKMGEQDFATRYEGKSEDEIGLLGRNMNTMAEKLESTITELKNANAKLQADIDKKEQVDKMRQEFIANVSHELKTPIALIQGYAEGLMDGMCEDKDSQDYYTSVIIDEADKMNKMVKQLLTLSALEVGGDSLNIERFDLTELISGVLQSTRILASEHDISFEFDDTNELFVWGDEFKIEEVTTNYVSNAIHHTPDGGHIKISTQLDGERVHVEVHNSGSHIPDEDLEHIWEKFYKVDKAHSREYGGSGIGLSIVKAIMEKHGMPYGAKNAEDGVIFWYEVDAKNE